MSSPQAGMSEQNIFLEKRRQNCDHDAPFLIDETLSTVECKKCGAHLNPIYCLSVLAKQWTNWSRRKAEAELTLKEIENKKRTKCFHCGKMTAIRVNIPYYKALESEVQP